MSAHRDHPAVLNPESHPAEAGSQGRHDAVDVVVIGAGPAGEVAAQYVTENSAFSVMIIERELLGGECSYYACIPSKALLTPISLAHQSEDLSGVTPAAVDRQALLRRRDEWVGNYDDSSQYSWAEGAGLQVVRGEARLIGERRVQVGERTVEARRAVVLATGSEAVIPAALQPANPWTSRDATGVREVPERLLIVGGGVVACEAATWLASLGASVMMLVRGKSLLGGMEPMAQDAVLKGLRGLGVTVELGTEVQSVDRPHVGDAQLGVPHGGEVTVHTSQGRRSADELLVATGRRPRLEGVGLDSVGLSARPGSWEGNRPLPWLYVLGDASGEAPLTHWGKYRARCIGEEIAGLPTASAEPPVPQAVFTEPHVAAVGLTEEAARAAGHSVVVSEVGAAAAGVALSRDTPPDAARLVVDAESGQLLGATFVGQCLIEVVHSATVAITGKVPVAQLRHAVASFPTASEIWLNLLEQLPASVRFATRSAHG